MHAPADLLSDRLSPATVYWQDKRVTSFLALRGDEGRGMLGRVASIGDGMASSLSRLLPSPRGAQKPAAGRQDAAAAAGSAAPKVISSACAAVIGVMHHL